jgi:hypothetical protein
MIEQSDFHEWKHENPVTIEIFRILRERQTKIGKQLASGACLGNHTEHGKAVGRFLEINDLLEMSYEDLFEDETP